MPLSCARISASCNGEDVREVKRFMRSTTTPLCAGCRGAMDVMGATYTLVERRAADRPFRPLWLSRLTARDDTGRLVA